MSWPRGHSESHRGPDPDGPSSVEAASRDGGFGGCEDDYEFAFGLDLILYGLERRRDSAT
jgi:hypothetical protein